MLQVGEHVGEGVSNELRHLHHWSQSTMGRPPELTSEELLGRAAIDVVPRTGGSALFELRRKSRASGTLPRQRSTLLSVHNGNRLLGLRIYLIDLDQHRKSWVPLGKALSHLTIGDPA